MLKSLVIGLLIVSYGCASSSSTSSNSSSSSSSNEGSSNVSKTISGPVKFSNSAPAEINGEEKSNGHEFMYKLTKKSAGSYKLEISTYKDSHDHRTTRTVYKSSVKTEKNGESLKVTIRYAKKPNSYSWHTIPQNVFEQTFNLKSRTITYTKTGSLIEKMTSKTKGESEITSSSLSEKEALDMSLKYFIRGYEDIFEH